MRKNLLKKLLESVQSVLPITVLVAILAWIFTDVSGKLMVLFLIGALMLILGMALFTLGADMAMMPMGSSVGSFLSKTKKSKFWLVALVCLVIGFVITIAEPDLMVLASQVSQSGINYYLLYSVAAGVGIFLVVSLLRTFFKVKLSYLLLGSYILVFALGIWLQFKNPSFLSIAFDSGGVTTGPITVPFLMAFGLGVAAVRSSDSQQEDSFGMVALCSVGPILAVMILGLTGGVITAPTNEIVELNKFADIFAAFGHGLIEVFKDVALALVPIIAVFTLFQIFVLKLPKSQIIKIIVGVVYTFIGLSIFLTGVDVGFMSMGVHLGRELSKLSYNWILIPIGMVIGALIVLAEPAIHVLNKQVEEVSGGAISKRAMLIFLCAGVAISVGLAMVRVLTGVSIWWFLVPTYVISLVLMFFVPPIFTGIAFDSGGVASGPMTATFLLPLAIGACSVLGNGAEMKIFTDGFGLVAFVAMTPLLAIQLLGLIYKLKTRRTLHKDSHALPDTLKPTLDSAIAFDEAGYDEEETVDFDTESVSHKFNEEELKEIMEEWEAWEKSEQESGKEEE